MIKRASNKYLMLHKKMCNYFARRLPANRKQAKPTLTPVIMLHLALCQPGKSFGPCLFPNNTNKTTKHCHGPRIKKISRLNIILDCLLIIIVYTFAESVNDALFPYISFDSNARMSANGSCAALPFFLFYLVNTISYLYGHISLQIHYGQIYLNFA